MSPILGIWASGQQGAFSTAYESIATVTVGAGGSSSISFSSIPSTYKHLQIRWIASSNRATYTVDDLFLDRINGSTASNTATHRIYSGVASPGTTPVADGFANSDGVYIGGISTSVATNTFGAGVVDLLDYTNTNKYKTFRALGGADANGFTAGYAPYVGINSGFIQDTTAISSFRIRPVVGTSLLQYSSFALYGVKG